MKFVAQSVTMMVIAASVVLASKSAHAELLVTELKTKSAVNPEDYFELTNTGVTPFSLTGWKFDDESALITEAVALNGITTVAPGESVVFFQLDEPDPLDPAYDPVGEVTLFRSYWGGLSGVQVGWHAGAGLGKGDAITLFDAADNQAIYLEYGMTAPEETHAGDWAAGNTDGSDTYENQAAVWVPGTSPQQFVLAAPGVFDSFANTAGEYGSPGLVGQVPEPSTFGLAAMALVLLAVARRKRT